LLLVVVAAVEDMVAVEVVAVISPPLQPSIHLLHIQLLLVAAEQHHQTEPFLLVALAQTLL
jgi:hypothetical protein